VRAAIHPSIGVARIGNSLEEYFLAPEVVHPPPQPPGFDRDASGALKRQAVRFRIYGKRLLTLTEAYGTGCVATRPVHHSRMLFS